MRAIVVDHPGGPEVLRLADLPDPVPARGEVLLRVRAAGVNRADVLQRMGLYPPPPGAPDTLGLEASGVVVARGDGVEGWAVGDDACALLAGGGYAELVAVPAGQLMRLPAGVDLLSAAAIPEAFLTAHDNLVTRAGLRAGETVLVHGGSGGVGSAAIQVARRMGCTVLTTAGSRDRLQRCAELGATGLIDHHDDDLVARVRELTGGRGADVVLDVMGASLLERNLESLALDGRLVVIGLQGGVRAEVDLNSMLRRRASIIATTLRARSVAQKAEIVRLGASELGPGFEDGSLRVVVDSVRPLAEAAGAHRRMETGGQFGKLLLEVAPEAADGLRPSRSPH